MEHATLLSQLDMSDQTGPKETNMGKFMTFLAFFAFSFSAAAGNANLNGDQVKAKVQEIIDGLKSEGSELDVASQFMNAAQIACGEENTGNPTVVSGGPFLKFAARHPIVSEIGRASCRERV